MATKNDLSEYLIRGFVNGLEQMRPQNEDQGENQGHWGDDGYYYCQCGHRFDLLRSGSVIDYFPTRDNHFDILCRECNKVMAVRGTK